MKRRWKEARPSFLGTLAHWLIRGVGTTLRIRAPGLEAIRELKEGVILCGWHGKSFIPGYFLRGKGVWVVVSHSRDGEVQNQIFSRLGFSVIRGSTGKGGVRAAIEAIRVLREGAWMAITPDGPRGPSGVVQGGVMLMAQKSGAALVPVGIVAKPCWRASSWDRFMIPLPFARATFLFGDPIYVPGDSDAEQMENLRLRLQEEIDRAEAAAEAHP